MLQPLILVLHVFTAFILIGLILLQPGKGSVMGSAFGSSASQTLFGSQGSDSFLLKLTSLLAFFFFVTSLSLSYLVSEQAKKDPIQKLEKLAEKLPPQPSASTASKELIARSL